MAKKNTNKLRGTAYQSVKSMAADVSGYNEHSIIWGKRLPEVLELLETSIKNATEDVLNGSYGLAATRLDDASVVIDQLKRRLAKQAIIKSQAS